MVRRFGIRRIYQGKNHIFIRQLVASAAQDMSCTEVIDMVYGYDSRTVNEYGLKQMREISVQCSSTALRDLAAFLLEVADEVEVASSDTWHRHAPNALQRKLGCDVIVFASF
jgi:hypothetical protein